MCNNCSDKVRLLADAVVATSLRPELDGSLNELSHRKKQKLVVEEQV